MVSSLQENHRPMTAVQKQTKNPSLLERSQEALPGKSYDLRNKKSQNQPKTNVRCSRAAQLTLLQHFRAGD